MCHVLYGLGAGGLENGVINVIRGLGPPDFRHSLCLLSGTGVFGKRLPDDMNVFELGKTEERARVLVTELARIFRREQVDIVHSRNWGSFVDAVLGARLARVPVCIHSIHGIYFEDLTRMKLRRLLAQRLLSRLTTRMFAVSDFLRSYYVDVVGVNPEKILTIRNGVSLEQFEPAAQKPASLLSELGIEPGEFVIGWVGTLYWVKDPEMLLNAAAVLEREAGVRFLVVGGGPMQDSPQATAERLGVSERVLFAGHRDDVPRLMQVMDIFVQTSVNEGMSNTILEAMASGLPCVVTDVGGNRELVTEGENGFLVASGDHTSLANRLAELLENKQLKDDMGRRSRSRATTDFTIARMTDQYRALYMRSMGRDA